MKYAIILLDGASRNAKGARGKTALEQADTPTFDEIAREGRVGWAALVRGGPAPKVAHAELLGFDAQELTDDAEAPTTTSMRDRFGAPAAMVTRNDELARVSQRTGWSIADAPPASRVGPGHVAAWGRATIELLERFDLVCCDLGWMFEPQGGQSPGAIESADTRVVGPVLRALRGFGCPERDGVGAGWRIAIISRPVLSADAGDSQDTPDAPFAMAGSWVRSVVKRRFTEADARRSDLGIEPGRLFMEYFMRSGGVSARAGSVHVAKARSRPGAGLFGQVDRPV